MDGEAPTTTIETVTVVRPLKVIAFLCLIVSMVLLVVSLASTTWLRSHGFRQGLFEECLSNNEDAIIITGALKYAPEPGTCQRVPNRGNVYIHVVAALLIIGSLLTLAGCILTAVGLKSLNTARKYMYYKAALYLSLLAVALEVAGLVTFPVCFYLELKELGVPRWDFDWAYGLGWGALVFTVGSAILLICDKEHEEIYYKEKTIMHEMKD